MAEDIFEVKRERFDLLHPEIYLLQGTWPEGYHVEAWLKKQQISGEVTPWDYVSVLDRFATREGVKMVTVSLTMPEKIVPSGKLGAVWHPADLLQYHRTDFLAILIFPSRLYI